MWCCCESSRDGAQGAAGTKATWRCVVLQRRGSGQNSALPTCECAVGFREGFSLLLRLY